MIEQLLDAGVPKHVATTFVAVNGNDPAIQTAITAHDHAATIALANNLPPGLDPAIRTAVVAKAAEYGGGPSATTPDGGTPPPGGDTPTGDNTPPPMNWADYLTNWGFSDDMIKELTRIFSVYPDASSASAAALGYIRGTDWYTTHFAGIGAGLSKGLFSDEAGYRAYLNQATGFYQRFFGRDISTNELVDYLNKGYTAGNIGQHLTGQGIVNANKPEIQYGLGNFADQPTGDQSSQGSPEQLAAYGDQLGGLDNAVGQQLQAKLAKAQARMAAIVQGTLATPALNVLKSGQLGSPSLGGSTTQGDVAS